MEPKDKENQIIYNNDFCYVTEDGRLYQKGNRFFRERHIADLDTRDIEVALNDYREAFRELSDQVEQEIREARSAHDIDRLSDNIIQSAAIGDYDTIAARLDTAKSELAGNIAGENTTPGGNQPESTTTASPAEPDTAGSATSETEDTNGISETAKSKETKASKETAEPDKIDDRSKTAETHGAEPTDKPGMIKEPAATAQEKPETSPGSVAGTAQESGTGESQDAANGEKIAGETETAGNGDKESYGDTEKGSGAVPGSADTAGTSGTVNESESGDVADALNNAHGDRKTKPGTVSRSHSDTVETAGTESETDPGADGGTDADADADAVNETGTASDAKPEQGVEPAAGAESIPEKTPLSEAEQYYMDLIRKAREYANQKDWSHIPQLFASIYDSWNVGPDLVESRKNELRNEVDKALELFNQNKSAHYEYQKEKKQKNIDQREYLLNKIRKIVDLKRWHATGEVNSIRRKWEDIRHLPSAEVVKDQNEAFEKLLEIFDENRVGYLVGLRESEEENLAGKLMILDKMEQLAQRAGPDMDIWDNLERELNELTQQWRKIGHVPKEKEDEVWTRYKSIKEQYYSRRAEYDESFRKELEKNVKVKKRLIRRAEELVEEKDLAKGIRIINKLHSEWKKSGMVPREESDKLWDEFKSASDAFNKLKSGNIDLIREQESENYQSKIKLCERAEALSDTDNWKSATDEMAALMAEWKTIGPVPRKKTNPVWTRFKRAMDNFYKKRRSYFKGARTEQKENLDKKRDIIAKLTELKDLENPNEAIDKAKPLQEEFKSIGFVPLKLKNKIWQQYKKALDDIYEKARSTKRASSSTGSQVHTPSERPEKRVQQEIYRLRRECDELRDTIHKYSDSMTYIKPNKKGLELRQEIQNNIDEAEYKLKEKLEKIEQLNSEE